MSDITARVWTGLAKSPIFTLGFFFSVGVLLFLAVRNHETVAPYVATVAAAWYGGGAWKNHSDQKYGNGSGASE